MQNYKKKLQIHVHSKKSIFLKWFGGSLKADLFFGVKTPNCSSIYHYRTGSILGLCLSHVLHLAAMCIISLTDQEVHLQYEPSHTTPTVLTHHYCTALPQRLFLSNHITIETIRGKKIHYCDKVTNMECRWQSLCIGLILDYYFHGIFCNQFAQSILCAVKCCPSHPLKQIQLLLW